MRVVYLPHQRLLSFLAVKDWWSWGIMRSFLFSAAVFCAMGSSALAHPDADTYQEHQYTPEPVQQDNESNAKTLQELMQEENLRQNQREALGYQDVPVSAQEGDRGNEYDRQNAPSAPNLPGTATSLEQQMRQEQILEAQQPNGNSVPTY